MLNRPTRWIFDLDIRCAQARERACAHTQRSCTATRTQVHTQAHTASPRSRPTVFLPYFIKGSEPCRNYTPATL